MGLSEPSLEGQVWTNANAGEVLPGVLSPMTWSILDPLLDAMFAPIFARFGLNLGSHRLIGLVAGRVYFHLNTVIALLRTIPFARRFDVDRLLGGQQQTGVSTGDVQIAEEHLPRIAGSRLTMAWKAPGALLWFLSHGPKQGLRLAEERRTTTEALQRVDLSALGDDQLIAFLDSVRNRLFDGKWFSCCVLGVSTVPALGALCRRWLSDANGSIANRLLSGMGGMESAEAGLDLWRLAVLARHDEAVHSAILAGSRFEALRHKLAELPAGRTWLNSWDLFQAMHGHHARAEVDPMVARWSEQPDELLESIRGFLSDTSADPTAVWSRSASEREALAAQCRKRLRNPIKRALFNYLLYQAQRGSIARENLKSDAVRLVAAARFALRELGARFAARGVLSDRDDIFFLRYPELEPVQKGDALLDAKAIVAQRRAEYNSNGRLSPPPVVVGRFDPMRDRPEPPIWNGEVFSGLPVSSGVATGRARVILSALSSERVLPGEVLVAPFTDPGWSPQFLSAAALVVDMGGLLSHGSIIAREYGIPAVVNVGPATRVIRTGQLLRVDGDCGEVRILEPATPRSPGP
jgi:pyruvate,water dikinase